MKRQIGEGKLANLKFSKIGDGPYFLKFGRVLVKGEGIAHIKL